MTSLAAGKPAPLGASYDGKGVNFAPLLRPCGAGGAVRIRRAG